MVKFLLAPKKEFYNEGESFVNIFAYNLIFFLLLLLLFDSSVCTVSYLEEFLFYIGFSYICLMFEDGLRGELKETEIPKASNPV